MGPRQIEHDDQDDDEDEDQVHARMVTVGAGRLRTAAQRHRDHEPQRGPRVVEARDLVVDEPARLRRRHDLDVAQGRRLALAGDDPDRAVGPEPLAQGGEGGEGRVVVGRQEHEVRVGSGSPWVMSLRPVAELELEGGVVEPDQRHPRARA